MEPQKSTLATKLANILGEVGKVEKTGTNEFHGYKYVTENDLVYAVRSKLAMAGIFVFTSVESQEARIIEDKSDPAKIRQSVLTLVELKHTFVDSETGEQFSVKSQGQGSDVGDKGGYKAITGAMKYFIYKCFLIPTGDDPEADAGTDRRTHGGDYQSAKPAAPAQPRQPARPVEVPRDPSPADKLPPNFRWEEAVIHFGKNEGTKLGELERNSLDWYANEWKPKPYKGRISPQDEKLRAALDLYLKEGNQ